MTWSLTLGGGESRIVRDLINHLNKEYYSIDILELNKGTKKIEIDSGIHFLNPIVNFTGDKLQEEKIVLTNYMKNPEQIKELFKEEYDCVIACNRGTTSFLCAYIPAKKRIVWILGSVNNLNENLASDQTEKKIAQLAHQKQAKAFEYYDTIIAVSDDLYESLTSLFPSQKEKIIKLYNCIDVTSIHQKAEQESILSYTAKYHLVNVARLVEVKNQKLLIDAMRFLSQKRDDTELFIIGDGPLEESLKKYIIEQKLENKIKLIGFLENPFPLIKQADLFCLSSVTEGFCLSITEACALGIPFVSTNVGGINELESVEKCGFISSNSPEEFADKIDYLLTNKTLYNEFKKNAVTASKTFDILNWITKFETLFDDKG